MENAEKMNFEKEARRLFCTIAPERREEVIYCLRKFLETGEPLPFAQTKFAPEEV